MNDKLNLPPQRDLPHADDMLNNILDDVAPAGTALQTRTRSYVIRGVAAAVAVIGIGVVGSQLIDWDNGGQVATPPSPSVTSTDEPTGEPTTTPSPDPSVTVTDPSVDPTSPQPSTPEPTGFPLATDEPPVARPTGPVTATAEPPGTFHLQYFDVSVLEQRFNDLGTATGVHVKVCYASPHPGANSDGTTRTSTNPWRFGVFDGETQTFDDTRYLRVDEFPASDEFQPVFKEKQLKVGECNEGWIGIEHGTPDAAWAAMRYQPADFGDEITWVFYTDG
ncbi:MAG: hypothetical protein Q4G35_05645 [Propionibacteriaceae bacterium]|nr:hypothetical protein [Propionibacteriaceae bacterium]